MLKSGLVFSSFCNPTSPFRVATAQCKKSCPERRNWPGRLAGNTEGASRISKQKKTTPLFTIIFIKKNKNGHLIFDFFSIRSVQNGSNLIKLDKKNVSKKVFKFTQRIKCFFYLGSDLSKMDQT